jgi:hypothetical protein
MFRGVIVTIQLSINSGRKTDTLPRKRFVSSAVGTRIRSGTNWWRRSRRHSLFEAPSRPQASAIRDRAARSRVARASATASSATRTASGAICVSSQPAAAALQAMPMVVGSVTIAIAVSNDWPVFQSVVTGCTQPASPQVSTARATGRPGSRSNLSATTPGASKPAATVAVPGAIAARTPQARPDNQTTDRLLLASPALRCRVGPCFVVGCLTAVAIHSAHSGKDQSNREGGKSGPGGDFLAQAGRERRSQYAAVGYLVQLGVDFRHARTCRA